MSNFSDQVEEIKTLISSSSTTNKALAYSTLLYLQEQSNQSPDLIQTLAHITPTLIQPILADVHDRDEEIAGQALKCLGFMTYHPSLIAAILVEEANLVLESLVKLVTTTKMKTVCNLGVWCISIQQFNEQVLVSHFNSLLQAAVHGLDNPFGSLSTTFEAMQAVMRLAVQLGEKMRDFSHVWAPPIYRRLLSSDKRERDMSERCLLKIRSLIVPPSLHLSKALVRDMKQTLLTGMKNLLNLGMKIQTIRAWGWFIQLLGSYALKNRNLINDMLKIPQHTFSDHDPQLQIASQVAWEGLIDALIYPAILPHKRSASEEDDRFEQIGMSKRQSNEIQENGLLKSVKLIMKPLIGIMSKKCDASVHASCFNTWCYLLHKLDSSVNCFSVKQLVLEPIYEAIFESGPDDKSICLWNMCINFLDDLILVKCRDLDNGSSNLESDHLSATTFITETTGNRSWKRYHVKWLPWELSLLEFHLKIIYILINQASKTSLSRQKRSLAYAASLRLFRTVSKGVQMELKKLSTTYDDILLGLSTMLKFMKNLCEENSEGSDRNDLHGTLLQLIEILSEEIEPAMLGSPLYKIALDLKYVESHNLADETRHVEVLEMCSITYMDMVSPSLYLTVLHFYVMAQLDLNNSNADLVVKSIEKYFKVMLSSYESLENFIITVGLLFKHIEPSYLRMWTEIARGLKDCIGDVKNIPLFEKDHRSTCVAICNFLCYPITVCYLHQQDLMTANISGPLEDSHVSLQGKLELEQVIDLWKSLYGSLSTFECFTTNKFSECLCNLLDGWLDKYADMFEAANELESSYKDLDLDNISFCGDILICVLEKSKASESRPDESNTCKSDYMISSGMNRCLTLAIRFMKLLQTKKGKDPNLIVATRLYSAFAHCIGCLHLKQDILSFIEIFSSPLLQWLSQIDMQEENNHSFHLVWTETLNCLRRSEPPLVFDSAFLKLQSPLLEKTLDHPNPTISEPTILFWNSTYGDQIKLDYPQNLLHVLDKLSRNGRISLHKRRPTVLERCDSGLRANTLPEKYRVNATNNNSSKRIELLKDASNHNEHKDTPCLNLKRKRLELTDHQKEVRRAQQGRARDCGGHGLGGIRTYTNVDFSQGNASDSQESQEIWNFESILDMSKKAS